MQYVYCPLMKLVSETFLKNLNKFNCESWQSQFKLEYFLWAPFLFVDANAGLDVKTHHCHHYLRDHCHKSGLVCVIIVIIVIIPGWYVSSLSLLS